MEWAEVVSKSSEKDLDDVLHGLSKEAVTTLQNQLLQLLQVPREVIERDILRLLIERARPFVLPPDVWRRPITASGSVRPLISKHLAALGVKYDDALLRRLHTLYGNFAEPRMRVRITEDLLRTANYACNLCGYRFIDDDLEELAFVSPHPKLKRSDSLKPLWSDAGKRQPTVDHVWPVSLYGSNGPGNLKVLCHSCNGGKQNYISFTQSRPSVGLPDRYQLESDTVTDELAYAVFSRMTYCEVCFKFPRDAELTIRRRRSNLPLVLDNLGVICYDCERLGRTIPI